MADEPFLSRWSRLKQDARTEAAPAPEVIAEPPADALPVAAENPEPEADTPCDELPPVESLTGSSDFTPFLRAGVPEGLHREALRKLWTSDPVYANLDGLKDYDEDYGALFRGDGLVKTLYRVGEGFVDEVAEAIPEAPEPPAPVENVAVAEGDQAPPTVVIKES